ncbi:MAG TPA: hypothetical protein VEZ14_06030 [Dehalococcoidia bacterium]|nr:hypothetical protein [Dehalococcoidia bacterium]
MAGKWVRGGEPPVARPGVIVQLRPYELHGTRYVAVLYRLDGDPDGSAREARLSHEMIYPHPRPGDRVLVASVLGVVDRIALAEPP